MLFEKYFFNYACSIFCFLICLGTADATVFKKACGGMTYVVEMYNAFDLFERKYKLYSQDYMGNKKLFFESESGILLNAACIQNKKKQELMLFLENSGGNAGPEDLYGIYDPNIEKMLIMHTSWYKGNYEEVKQLIGYPPPFPTDKNEKLFFCCYAEIRNYN